MRLFQTLCFEDRSLRAIIRETVAKEDGIAALSERHGRSDRPLGVEERTQIPGIHGTR